MICIDVGSSLLESRFCPNRFWIGFWWGLLRFGGWVIDWRGIRVFYCLCCIISASLSFLEWSSWEESYSLPSYFLSVRECSTNLTSFFFCLSLLVGSWTSLIYLRGYSCRCLLKFFGIASLCILDSSIDFLAPVNIMLFKPFGTIELWPIWLIYFRYYSLRFDASSGRYWLYTSSNREDLFCTL